MDISSLKKWATPAKPKSHAQTPVTAKGPADKGEEKAGADRCWEGCAADDIAALTDADLDAFDAWLAEQRPEVRETLLELADSIAEPNTKMRSHAETELSGQVSEETDEEGGAGDGLTPSQVSMLAEQLEMAVADEGFEPGSDDLRRAALRALAMVRSPDSGEDEEPAEEEEAPPPPGKVPPKPGAKAPPAAKMPPPGGKARPPMPAKKPALGGRGM